VALAKYSSEPTGSAFMDLPPGCQEAGQTSPCTSAPTNSTSADIEENGGKTKEAKRGIGRFTSELEGLNKAENLVRVTPHGKIVDDRGAKVALAINDEKTTQSNSSIPTVLKNHKCELRKNGAGK
jgi:hypothetical protein